MCFVTYKIESGAFKMTHQATATGHYLHMVFVVAIILIPSINVSVAAPFCDGRTDTMSENNDHLFGCSLMGQKKANLCGLIIQCL